jgi:hypothetical protein
MKKEPFIILFFTVIALGCPHSSNGNNSLANIDRGKDTIVESKTVPHEISTSEFKEKEYFLVTGKDTSSLSCIFSENKNNGNISVTLDCNDFSKYSLTPISFLSDTSAIGEKHIEHKTPYYKMTYQQQMEALHLILKESSKEFDLSKTRSISLMLLCSGDLAIEVTDQYTKRFGTKVSTSKYRELENILAGSQLKPDLDELFIPYSVFTDRIAIEKVYFTNKKDFLAKSKANSTVKIPNAILSCFIYITLKKTEI